jgi:hypothetical protein
MLQPMQSVAQEMQNKEKINDDQNRIDKQFNQKCAQCFDCLFFHSFQRLRLRWGIWSREIGSKVKFRCAETGFPYRLTLAEF